MSAPYASTGVREAKAATSWKMTASKQCPVCFGVFYPAPNAKKHLWERRTYCCCTCASLATAKRRYGH